MSHQNRTADAVFSTRSVDATGRTFSGYASVFGVTDSYGDIVARGAFTRTLRERPKVLMLWHHAPSQPIGVWTEIREDDRGLFVRGRISQTPMGDEAITLLRDGAIDGLSIGFQIVKSHLNDHGGQRMVTDVELYECSIVSMPANDAARISDVRAASLGGPRAEAYVIEQRLAASDRTLTAQLKAVNDTLTRIANRRDDAAAVAPDPARAVAPFAVRQLEYQALMARHLSSIF